MRTTKGVHKKIHGKWKGQIVLSDLDGYGLSLHSGCFSDSDKMDF